MADKAKRLVLADLRHGRNGYDAPWAIGDHEVVDNPNIDYYRSRFGNKRSGLATVSTTFSAGGPFTGNISSIFRHVPTTDETLAELWAFDDAATPIVGRLAGATTWTAPTLKDALTGNGWDVSAATVNGKLFLAYKSAQARLHCWDTATVRRAGFATPAAVTVANTGAGADVTFDAAATLNYAAGTTFSHTCAASATILLVYTRADTALVTAVTYNGVALTQITSVISGGNYQLWYLVSPASGAHTVAITSTSSVGAASVSYVGSAITGIPDASTTNTSAAATITTSLTTVADRCWLVYGVSDRSGAAPIAGTGSTVRATPGAATSMALFDHNTAVSPAGSTSMTVNIAASQQGAAILASFAGGGVPYTALARYYRIRWTQQSAGITIRRSEPGTGLAFTPSGTGTAARITQPTVANEGETHWEIEASLDNVSYYRITTVAIGTTTYDDSAATTSYSGNTLSELTGKYQAQKSYKFVAADQNRLLGFGSYTATDKQARLEISAVIGSADIGDAERVDTSVVNSIIDLDENDSGFAVGLAGPCLGSFFAFKDRQVWQLTATGSPAQPYRQDAISKSIGAIEHTAIVRAEDKLGNAALFWMSHRGPYRWSTTGLDYIGREIEDYVLGSNATINLAATKRKAVAVYYPDKRQVWFWWATGTSNDPNVGFIYDVQTEGWSRVPSTDRWANVRCACLFANTIAAAMSRDLKPYVGETGSTNQLSKADTGTDDRGTAFRAYVITKALEPGGPGCFGGVGDADLLAVASAGVTITDTVTADFGLQTQTGTALLTPTAAGETRVSRRLEGSALSGDVQFVQHQIGDAAAVANSWTLDRLVIPLTKYDPVSA